MRVLVEGDDIHVWAPFGALTLHGGGERVEWRSPYHPQLDFAPRNASDVRLPASAFQAPICLGLWRDHGVDDGGRGVDRAVVVRNLEVAIAIPVGPPAVLGDP